MNDETPNTISRRTFSSLITVGAASATIPALARAAPPARVRNVVLVHGAYADGSCWSDVIVRLQAQGLRATAVQHPLTTLTACAEVVQRAIALQDGPTVLVGHSYGGVIVSQAGIDPRIAALVYIAARAPDAGEDYAALAKTHPTPPIGAGLITTDGYIRIAEQAFLRDFANGVQLQRAKVLQAVQGPVSDRLFQGRTSDAAWRHKPSWYAVSEQDRTIDPDLQRFMAKRMKATTTEIPSGHLSMISHPDAVAKLIVAAAG